MLPDLSDLRPQPLSTPEPDSLLEGLSLEQLQEALQACQEFRSSLGHKLFLKDLQQGLEQGETVLLAVPQSLGDFTNREQLIGARSNITSMQKWFDSAVATIEQTIEHRKEEDNAHQEV